MPDTVLQIETELATGLKLQKCRKCGCMQDALRSLFAALTQVENSPQTLALRDQVAAWSGQMKPVRYTCLGCQHCYPAAAQNLFAARFPHIELSMAGCTFQINAETWPPVTGDYFVLSPSAPVAVSTLASVALAKKLADHRPPGLAIVGKTETENIGIDKIIKNSITNPALRYLVVCGADPKGHQTGQTLLALTSNGTDEKRRVVGAPGKRPILQNVSRDEIKRFRGQIQVIDMIGCRDVEAISTQIDALAAEPAPECCGSDCCEPAAPVANVPKITVSAPDKTITLDKAGYFVILPVPQRGLINVEHYSYQNVLLHVLEGETARALYLNIVDHGWVTELSHAAYLGKELAKAELCLHHGLNYVQDGA